MLSGSRNSQYSQSGLRSLAAGIVKVAYQDYWKGYKKLRTIQEIYPTCKDPNKLGGYNTQVKYLRYSLKSIELFFESNWYNEVLRDLAPTLSCCRFEAFKKMLPEVYEAFKSGKAGFADTWSFVDEAE